MIVSIPNRLRERCKAQLHKHSQAPRYAVISVLCAILHNGILIGLDRAGAHYVVGQSVSAVVLVPTGYFLLSRYVFFSAPSWKRFSQYSVAVLTNFPVAICLLWILCDLLSLDMVYSAPISMIGLWLWNYAVSRLVFTHSAHNNGEPIV